MKFAKYFAWLLLVAGVGQIGFALTQSSPRAVDGIYCDYLAGSWHCQEHSQLLMVPPVTWAKYILPFSVSLLLVGAVMLHGAIDAARKKNVYYAFVALAVLLIVQVNYKPKVYAQRNDEAASGIAAPSGQQPSPSPESAGPQKMQTASVTVWTKPDRSPATAHTEMYPQEDSVLYLAYSGNGNAVAFSGFDAGLAVQIGSQYTVTNEGGFPARYNPNAVYVLYDVRNGWLRYSDLSDLGRAIVQHFCAANHLALYEVIDRRQADYLRGPSASNIASVCGRQIREASASGSQQSPASASGASTLLSQQPQLSVPANLAASSPNAEAFNPLGEPQEKKFADYTIRIYGDPNDEESEGSLEILKQGTRVYAEQHASFQIESTGAPIGADVTGAGIPNLVVKEYSGGAHCCTSFDVFELGSSFRKVSTIEQGDCDLGKFQRENNGRYLFYGCDPSTATGGSRRQVVLRYENGAFRLQD